jgi:hypothetical protein
MAAGEPGTEPGHTKLESPRRVPSPGGFGMTISLREAGMPQTVSRNSPSTNVLPSTSGPAPRRRRSRRRDLPPSGRRDRSVVHATWALSTAHPPRRPPSPEGQACKPVKISLKITRISCRSGCSSPHESARLWGLSDGAVPSSAARRGTARALWPGIHRPEHCKQSFDRGKLVC